MPYNPKQHHRHSIRLRKFDYTLQGAYFITICTHQRKCVLGQIKDEKMHLSDLGIMVQNAWLNIPNQHNDILLDQFIIMPNHIHGIVAIKHGIVGSEYLGVASYAPTDKPTHLGDVVRKFKSITTVKANRTFERPSQKLWQTNYYERIIRNGKELNAIIKYIYDNPKNWKYDTEFVKT